MTTISDQEQAKDPSHYLTQSDYELIESLAKFLNKDKKDVTNSIELFSDTDKISRVIFYYLSKVEKDKLIEVKLLLEYLLRCDGKMEDIIDKNNVLQNETKK